jgi:hypothetical protein
MDLSITLVRIPPFPIFSRFGLWMDATPCSCASSHGPNGCTCTPSRGQFPSRPVLQLTGPLASTVPTFTTPYVHFPTRQSGTDVFNASHDHHNLQRRYELHDHFVDSRPMSSRLSDSHFHLPPQSFQLHFPSSNGQISGDSQATSI